MNGLPALRFSAASSNWLAFACPVLDDFTILGAFQSSQGLGTGTNFYSWNNRSTPTDETFDSFMTLAFKFCAHAETSGQGYRLPAQRFMRLLAVFNPELRQQYDQQPDTPAADQFRATLLVTALSYAFQSDLRPEFRARPLPDQRHHLRPPHGPD